MSLDDLGGWPALLRPLTQGQDLTIDAAEQAMAEILEGRATPAQIAAFIVALRMKGESVAEMTGLVRGMMRVATPLPLGDLTDIAIDVVGAGGAPVRQRHALNVSTMACFVAAGAGAVVCKHGNRRASSTSGAFDFLELLGIPVDLAPASVVACVREAGIGFAFARTFHPAMRHAAPVRAEIAIATVFNVLGPLAHPARLRRGLIGAGDDAVAAKMAAVLAANGARRAWVVTGHGPIDEVSLTGPTEVHVVEDGEVADRRRITPESLGLRSLPADALTGGGPERNVEIFEGILAGEQSPYCDIVLLNAAAALVVAGRAADLDEGLALASRAIASGAAAAKLDSLRAVISRAP